MKTARFDDSTRQNPGFVTSSFREEVVRGLSASVKTIPSKFLYDERGSLLFDRITRLEEYYPTRTEASILRRHTDAIASLMGPECLLVEYGSGSGEKIRFILDRLERPAGYMPIDIFPAQLLHVAQELAANYPDLEIMPINADYTGPIDLPRLAHEPMRKVAFFPGSTIGNFRPEEAEIFFNRLARTFGQGGALLIGVDLKKDRSILERAYNDDAGLTAAFNLNLIYRVNREFNASIPLGNFRHQAWYNESQGRIEMRLVGVRNQVLLLGGRAFPLAKDDFITTEYSYKYSLAEFAALAEKSGLEVLKVWTDDKRLFSVQYLRIR